jgi:hypothetical protein
MTTIAYSPAHRQMAADTLISDEEYLSKYYMTKIMRRADGTLFGTSKGLYEGAVFQAFFTDQASAQKVTALPSTSEDPEPFEALVVKPNGDILLYNKFLQPIVLNRDSYHAIGSGAKCAMAAMFVGATPERAVAAAAMYDLYTGGGVTVLNL